MDWIEPHPRRLPTPMEVKENTAKIQELDEKITLLTMQIDELTRARESLHEERATKVSFIAAFRHLPPEILCQIARYSLIDNTVSERSRLNQINSFMRQAINGMKTLWINIHMCGIKRSGLFADVILFSAPNNGTIQCRNTDYLQLVLERSAPAPLDITIDTDTVDVERWDILTAIASRIRFLHLEGTRNFPSLPLMALPPLKMPLLERLRLGFSVMYSENMVKYLFDMALTSHSDNLHMILDFEGNHESDPLSEHPIFNQIATLELKDRFTQGLIPSTCSNLQNLSLYPRHYDILEQMDTSNLTSLCLRGGIHTNAVWEAPEMLPQQLRMLNLHDILMREEAAPESPISLPSVTFLALSGVNFDYPFFQFFHLPNIEELIIHKAIYRLKKEITRTSTTNKNILNIFGELKSVKRLWMECLSESWSQDFSTLPNLETLKIVDCRLNKVDEDFLRLFKQKRYIPHLKELLIQNCDRVQFSLENVRPIAVQRRPSVRVYGDEVSESCLSYQFQGSFVPSPYRFAMDSMFGQSFGQPSTGFGSYSFGQPLFGQPFGDPFGGVSVPLNEEGPASDDEEFSEDEDESPDEELSGDDEETENDEGSSE